MWLTNLYTVCIQIFEKCNFCSGHLHRVETGLDQPGYPGQVLSRSSRSRYNLVYKISRSDVNSGLDQVH